MESTQHPWRTMTLTLAGVLLCSFLLQKLTSPVGDAAVRAVDGRKVMVTGVVSEVSGPSRGYALDDGQVLYLLRHTDAVAPFTGRRVQVTGTLHQATGVLDIKSIALESSRTSGIDRTVGRP